VGRPTHGLRMPKPKGKDQIQKRLQKKSPWFQSIVDPIHGADCKIPDETGVETGTMQAVHRFAQTAQTSGIVGICVSDPYPAVVNATVNKNAFYIDAVNSTSNNLIWSATGIEFESTQPLIDFAEATRIVSAAVYVQTEASLSGNQGIYTTFAAGFPEGSSYEDFPRDGDTLEYIQNHYKSAIIPLNNNKPAMVRWYPLAREEFDFKSFISTDRVTGDYPPKWVLMIVGTGLAPSTVHEFTVVINYEFIPNANAINILDATPSPKDATEVDLVETWVQDLDIGTMTSTKTVSSSPSAVNPSHEDDQTGFGMFSNVLTELLPYAAEAAMLLL